MRDAIIEEYRAYRADRLRPMVRDTTVMTYEAVKAGKEVLFEGAQGTLLDLDMGTYPYVTSSHPVAGGCCIGSGVGPTAIDKIMGIFKSYTTRVGEGRSRPSCSMRPATISAMQAASSVPLPAVRAVPAGSTLSLHAMLSA